MKISVTVVEGQALADRWRDQSERSERVVRSMLRQVAGEHVKASQQLAGAGPFGRSFTARELSGLAVESGSTSPMAALLEDGRKPGRRPPPQSIINRSGGSYTAAAKAADRIAARGTRGLRVVHRAAVKIRRDGTVEQIARNGLRTILEG